MQRVRDLLETRQVHIYFGSVVAGAVFTLIAPATMAFEKAINPALAFMLFVTFLQVPLADLGRAFTRWQFTSALLAANFVAIPLLVAALAQLLPVDPLIRLGVLLVLLTPCIDYVVTFAHLGRADAKLLLAATPALLLLQMALLPVFLRLILGDSAVELVRAGPFFHAFLWLIAIPLVLAGLVQFWAARASLGAAVSSVLGVLPVPATAFVLFVVVAAVVPQLQPALDAVVVAVPFYVAFAVLAPLAGWGVGKAFGLKAEEARAVAFSTATRNSLVVLPLALAVPGAFPILPAIIVTQTLVELISELFYIRTIPRLGQALPA